MQWHSCEPQVHDGQFVNALQQYTSSRWRVPAMLSLHSNRIPCARASERMGSSKIPDPPPTFCHHSAGKDTAAPPARPCVQPNPVQKLCNL